MTGPGRPSTGIRTEVRLPARLLADVDRLADNAGVTRAVMLRYVVAAGVAVRERDTAVP